MTTIPLFHEILSGAPPPVYARWIEGSPVIAGFDDEDAKTRMDGIVKYISASTPQALMWKVMERFMNGPDNSTAVLTLRGGSGQVKEVKVTRSRGYWPARFEQRSGEIVKLLPGNIGYADLDRLRISMVDAVFDGLQLDVEVKPTIKGIREGRDEVLERAIEYLNAIP